MDIKQIRGLDVGMGGISCSGKVTWAGEPKHITGSTEDGRDYDFWSQFAVIDDTSDKIGVSVSVETGQMKLTKGDFVTIEKAELQSYKDKNDKLTLKLQGRIKEIAPRNGQPTPQQAVKEIGNLVNRPETKKEPDWDAKDKRMARMCGLNNAVSMLVAQAEVLQKNDFLDAEQAKAVAADFVEWIYNGSDSQSSEPEPPF